MFGYHQGSEALWFADSDAAADAENQHLGDDDATSLGAAAMLAERWCATGVLLGSALTSRCGNALHLGLNSVLLRILLLPPTSELAPSSPLSLQLMQQLCQSRVRALRNASLSSRHPSDRLFPSCH